MPRYDLTWRKPIRNLNCEMLHRMPGLTGSVGEHGTSQTPAGMSSDSADTQSTHHGQACGTPAKRNFTPSRHLGTTPGDFREVQQ